MVGYRDRRAVRTAQDEARVRVVRVVREEEGENMSFVEGRIGEKLKRRVHGCVKLVAPGQLESLHRVENVGQRRDGQGALFCAVGFCRRKLDNVRNRKE